jgi:ATP/maltotriose-dependent transcriptional regulator MalT
MWASRAGSAVRTPGRGVLERERVNGLFDRITSFPASLIIAPAGSGKTTALTQFADRTQATVLWARTDSLDGSAHALVAHLDVLHSDAMGSEPSGWTRPRDVGAGIARSGATPVVIVIDDFHLIRDRPAAGVVDELLATMPPGAHLVLSSRSMPSFDMSRLILSSDVHEIDADDLRFRTWEAERLINQIYHLALGPEDVARLTRRVEGWAAGLQLYHLAVRSKSPSDQRRLIDVSSSRSSLARQYLTRNVLHDLPPDVREFLLLTSVLGVVSGPIADEYLGRSGSHAILRHLQELQLFVTPIDSESAVRYHEVLRSHLETELGEEIGHDELTRRFGAAAPLLERAGFAGESLRCWARAGRWDEVSRLVGAGGSDPLDQLYDWLDLLPSGVADDDPWLLQAQARSDLARGRLHQAIAHYRRAEALFGESDAVVSCKTERHNLESFLDAFATDPPGWLGVLRRGLRTAPLESAETLRHLDDALSQLAAGLLCLCAGEPRRAVDHFDASSSTTPQPAGRSWPLISQASSSGCSIRPPRRRPTNSTRSRISRSTTGSPEWRGHCWHSPIAPTDRPTRAPSHTAATATAIRGARCWRRCAQGSATCAPDDHARTTCREPPISPGD